MDIGSSIAIYLVLLLVLLTLFCILTKYFNHKLVQSIQSIAELNSIANEEGLQQSLSEEGEMDYQKFKQQEIKKILRVESKKKFGYQEIQMSQIKIPFNRDDGLYSPNLLRRKLNNEITPIGISINRSMSSFKQFQPDKINTTNRTGRSNQDLELPKTPAKEPANADTQQPTYHTFINKMVSYDSQGLTVVYINVTAIRKLAEKYFTETKTVKTQITSINQKNFEDQLEIFGFEVGDFGCYKYLTKIDVKSMKKNEDYSLKSLKTFEVKQPMEVSEYVRVKMQLQNSI